MYRRHASSARRRWVGTVGLVLLLWLIWAPLSHAQADPPNRFGVHLVGEPTATRVEALQSLGVDWVRLALSWREVQPTPDATYRWEMYDTWFATLAEAGVRPIVIIGDIPDWAAMRHPNDGRIRGCGPVRAEAVPAFQAFLRHLVARYGRPPYNVTHWEIANEPDYIPRVARPRSEVGEVDLGGCFGLVWREAYARHLRQAYEAIKAAQPNAVVLLGGLAYDYFYWPERGERGPFDPLFLDVVVGEQKALDYADALALHAYPEWADRWWPWGPGIQGKINYVRAQLDAWGYLDTPIILTEVGRPSQPWVMTQRSDYTPAAQAAYVPKVFARVLAVLPDQPFIWYSLEDVPTKDPPEHFGLLEANGRPKPAFAAFRFAVRRFRGARLVRAYTMPPPNMQWAPQNVEAYLYRRADDAFLILWSVNGRTTVRVQAAAVMVWSPLGQEREVRDGGPGDDDGASDSHITLTLGNTPMYLEGDVIRRLAQVPHPAVTRAPTPTPWPTLTPTPATFGERITVYRPFPLNQPWFPLGLLVLAAAAAAVTTVALWNNDEVE